MAIYDPCKPRSRGPVPNVDDRQDRTEYVRIEQLLSPGNKMATPSGRRIAVQEIHNEVISRIPYVFHYQTYDEPRACHEFTSEVSPGLRSGLRQLTSSKRWCFTELGSQPVSAKRLSARDGQLRRIGNTQSWLAESRRTILRTPAHGPVLFLSQVVLQLLLSLGHQARIVSVEHGMTEVWSNQHRKWIVMDAELDHHFEKDGVAIDNRGAA